MRARSSAARVFVVGVAWARAVGGKGPRAGAPSRILRAVRRRRRHFEPAARRRRRVGARGGGIAERSASPPDPAFCVPRTAASSISRRTTTGGAREPGDKRTGVFTSGIVSIGAMWRIALFFTGPKHAGENIAEVLKRRASELPVPIQMCDALSRNAPKSKETLLANCLAHYLDFGVIQSGCWKVVQVGIQCGATDPGTPDKVM